MTKAYVFCNVDNDDHEYYKLYDDETIVIPELKIENSYQLAIFLPNLLKTQDLDNAIQYALKEGKIFTYACLAHVSPDKEIYYAGLDNFGSEDNLRC